MLQHSVGILIRPQQTWSQLAAQSEGEHAKLLVYPLLLATLPALAWFWGTTHVGWSVGAGESVTRLTPDSARLISFLFYAGMIACIAAIGYFVHWMADTYGADSSINKGIMLASICATPLFFTGMVGFYPILWLDMLVGVAAISWSVYLLYLGIPIVMDIPESRGFLFASAVVAIALVIFVCLLVATVMLWEWGAMPAFTD